MENLTFIATKLASLISNIVVLYPSIITEADITYRIFDSRSRAARDLQSFVAACPLDGETPPIIPPPEAQRLALRHAAAQYYYLYAMGEVAREEYKDDRISLIADRWKMAIDQTKLRNLEALRREISLEASGLFSTNETDAKKAGASLAHLAASLPIFH